MKIADDIFDGGQTVDEALDNRISVLETTSTISKSLLMLGLSPTPGF